MPDVPVTRDYHERTKLFPGASNAPRRVDAALIPKQYKRYLDLPSIALPPPSRSNRSLFEVLGNPSGTPRALTLDALSAVLHYSAGIVRRTNVGGRELAFRAASCTGALYHVELYVFCGGIEGLDAGLYHYDVPSNALRLMRTGDHRRALADACCHEAIATAAASVVLTSTFWRNAWRYEERAYRHVFWDAGTLLANLLAVSEAHALHPRLYNAFVDHDLNAHLSLDTRKEVTVAAVSLGPDTFSSKSSVLSALDLKTEPLSRAEIEYPLIWQTHAATGLPDSDAVAPWRTQASGDTADNTMHSGVTDSLTLAESIERRGSARRFSKAPLAREAFDAVLAAALTSVRTDSPLAATLCRPMLIINNVAGLEAGAYRVDDQDELSLIQPGDTATDAAHLALDQPAAGSAAANLYFVAHLSDVTATMGGRGYRAVQLEAGIRTGNAYLAASSLGLKASGLTFYDDEVTAFFGLDPGEDIVLMLVVFGA